MLIFHSSVNEKFKLVYESHSSRDSLNRYFSGHSFILVTEFNIMYDDNITATVVEKLYK